MDGCVEHGLQDGALVDEVTGSVDHHDAVVFAQELGLQGDEMAFSRQHDFDGHSLQEAGAWSGKGCGLISAQVFGREGLAGVLEIPGLESVQIHVCFQSEALLHPRQRSLHPGIEGIEPFLASDLSEVADHDEAERILVIADLS